MKNLELNQMEAVQGGSYWSDLADSAVKCAIGMAMAFGGTLPLGLALAGCAY